MQTLHRFCKEIATNSALNLGNMISSSDTAGLRSQQRLSLVSCRYVGLWQTSVLALNLAAPPRLRQEPAKPTINFLFGDDSSARTQVDVPYNQRSAGMFILGTFAKLFSCNLPWMYRIMCTKGSATFCDNLWYVHTSSCVQQRIRSRTAPSCQGGVMFQGLIRMCRYEEVHVGEPAELLLLSNTPDFSSYKVSPHGSLHPHKDLSSHNCL